MTRSNTTPCPPIPISKTTKPNGLRGRNPAVAALALGLLALASYVAAPVASAQPGEGAYCTRQAFDAFLNSLKRVEGRLSLVVTPTQKTYKVGEPIRITVTSPVAGDLLLMSIDSKGVVFPIFPNPHQAEGAGAAIAANSALTLPQPEQGYAFETQGPLGPSRLIAIVRPPGVQIPLPCARPLTKGVAISIGDGQGVADPEPPLPKFLEGWGYANFSYEVTAAK